MHRLMVLFGSALLAGGCSATTASPMASPPATGPASAATANPTSSPPDATPRPTPTPVPVAGCPTRSPITVWELVDSDQRCFESDDVVFRGWLDVPPPTGFEGPTIEPGWVAYPPGNLSALWGGVPIGPDQTCTLDEHGCGWIFAHINPTSGLVLEDPPRWLTVTGHFQDPAAETCQYVYPDDYTEERADDRYAVEHCRAQFVLVSISDAP